MEITVSIVLFILGLTLLIIGSNWLIQSSVKLSFLLKLTPLFIGAVLIAFGTSAPEAGVGIMAALRNQKGIALSNIIGSNIANIGLILGLCALLRPLKVDKGIFQREMPFLFLSVILFYFLSRDLVISRFDGIIFIATFIIFCCTSFYGSKGSFDADGVKGFKLNNFLNKLTAYPGVLLIILLSLAGIVFGADLMVRGGVVLAKELGLTPWFIGITIFALGTSLPELATSLTASFKKVPSISVGNIVGSNICNILLILGVVALIQPIDLDSSILRFEVPALAFFTLILFTVMRIRYRISRMEGLAMVLGYLGFLVVLITKRI